MTSGSAASKAPGSVHGAERNAPGSVHGTERNAPCSVHDTERNAPIDVLGVRVHAMTIGLLNARVEEAVRSGSKMIAGCHNLHSVYLFPRDPEMRKFYDIATDIFMDGMSIVAWARLMGHAVNRDHRVTWLDWLDPLLALAASRRWRVYYLGSAPGIAGRGAEILMRRHPGLEMRARHGYFDAAPGSADNRAIVQEINAHAPQLVMVGMGQPRQEKWVWHHAALLDTNAIFMPGACMDYVAGEIPTPWRPLGRLGLEWAFRLASEPRRLGPRYLIEPWFLAGPAARDLADRWRRLFASRKGRLE